MAIYNKKKTMAQLKNWQDKWTNISKKRKYILSKLQLKIQLRGVPTVAQWWKIWHCPSYGLHPFPGLGTSIFHRWGVCVGGGDTTVKKMQIKTTIKSHPVAQQVKDPVSPVQWLGLQLWRGFHPWPENFHMP